jgi:hypothetical protein
MLCSDGLYSLVSEGEIATTVTRLSPQASCVKLVELAKARGGFDNITVAIVPLAGQVRQSPPPNYRQQVKSEVSETETEKSPKGKLGKHILLLSLLSGLAIAVTAGLFLASHYLGFGFK